MIARAIMHNLRCCFAKKRKVRQLADAKINLFEQQPQQILPNTLSSYADVRAKLQNLGWENMNFDRLCNLPEQTIQAIEIQIKKDKFNVPDNYFQAYGVGVFSHNEASMLQLNPYYQRLYALISNKHEVYDMLQQPRQPNAKYLHQIYVMDICKDKALHAILSYFVNNLQFPSKLESVAQPSFVKKLLTSKRELIIQGVKFTTQEDIKKTKQQSKNIQKKQNGTINSKSSKDKQQKEIGGEDTDNQLEQKDLLVDQILAEEEVEEVGKEAEGEAEEEQQLSQVQQQIKLTNRLQSIMKQMQKYSNNLQILQVIGYEYQFWIDVKHNRNKNGVQQDYIIEERQINNPNQTLLLTTRFPTIKVKYIMHKKKRKEYAMHFCTKVELLLKINREHIRRVKVQWNGPSNKQLGETQNDYKVIDYEYLMNGNPTIRKVFQF